MGGLFKAIFGGGEKAPKVVKPTEKAGAKEQARARQRQGRALAATDLSGLRRQIGAFQSGKTTLGG